MLHHKDRDEFESNRPKWLKRLDAVLYYLHDRGDAITGIIFCSIVATLGACGVVLAVWALLMIMFVWSVK